MRGRKPRPVELRIIEGNAGKRELPPPFKVAGDAPEAPGHLDAIGLAEWRRMEGELRLNGLLTILDRAALAAYCVAYSHWVKAEEEVNVRGVLYKKPNGQYVRSPFIEVSHSAMMIMRAFLSEFGMTPVSRTRLSALSEGGAGANNPYAALDRL